MNKQNWLNDNIKPLVGLLIILGVLTYLFMVTLISNDNTIRSQALIAMVGLGTSVAGYYYGYSQGASKKDEVIASQTASPTITNADTVNVGK